MKKRIGFQWIMALASALLLAVVWDPFKQSQAAFFALVPLLLLVRSCSPKRCFMWGFYVGFLAWIIQLSWMWRLTDNNGPWILILPAWIGLSAYLALFMGGFAALAAKLRRWVMEHTFGAPTALLKIGLVAVVEPLLWVGFEALRSHLFTGFAWNPLGLVCTEYLWVAQLAAIGGVSLVSALLVAVNGAIATIVERLWQAMTHTTPLTFGLRALQSFESCIPLACFAAAAVWGHQRIQTYQTQDHTMLSVVVQHTTVPSIFSGEAMELPWEAAANQADVLSLLPQRPALWVWPESAAPGRYPINTAFPEWNLRMLVQRADVPLLMGGAYVKGEDEMNAALLFTKNGLDREQVYAKRHLVPFGEYIPLDDVFPFLERFVPIGVSLAAGEAVTTLTLPNGTVIGPLICFEDTVAEVARQSVKDGARLLVNMSNDAWYAPSFEAEQHARQAVFRCIETGTPMVRSTNSGLNTMIDAIGRATVIPPQQFPTFVPVDAQPYGSFYLTYGEALFAGPCTLVTLCLALLFLVGRIVKKKAVVAALVCGLTLPAWALDDIIPVADMAMDDGNVNLAERTAHVVLSTLGISTEERAKAQEILIRTALAKEDWQEALRLIEASPELPASHRLVLTLAAYHGSQQYTKVQKAYAEAQLSTEDAWGVAALRLALQADLALGTTLRAQQHFAAIDKATGADDRLRAENALVWNQRFPNDASRAALLRGAKLATQGEPFLACAQALPTAFAEAADRATALKTLDALLADEALNSTTRAQIALATIPLAASHEEKVKYARQAVGAARTEEVRVEALATLGSLLCEDPSSIEEGLKLLKDAVQKNPSAPGAPALQLRIAETLQAQQKSDEALEAYDHYLSSYDVPEFRVRVRQGKARTLLAADRPDEALAAFVEATDWATTSTQRLALMKETAEAAMAARRYTRAVALYREVYKDEPSPKVALRLAFALESAGEDDEARNFYMILRNDPATSPEILTIAVLHLGKLYANEGRHREALAEYTRAMGSATGRDREQLLLARARAYYALGQLARARDDVAPICASTDATIASEARFFMVISLYGLGEDDQAREYAQAYVTAYPESSRLPDVFLWIAKSDFNRGEYDAACSGFESFGTRWPNEARVPQSLFLAARAAYQDQNYVKVVELVGRLAKEYPQASMLGDARFLQAEALMELARHAEARELLSALILRYPNAHWMGEAHGRLGDCLFTTATDDPERAVQALEAYREAISRLEYDPDNSVMYLYKIGRIFEKQNRRDDAAEQYTKLIYRVLNAPDRYSVVGIRWMEKAMTQLYVLERARGNLSAYETLRRRVKAARLSGLDKTFD